MQWLTIVSTEYRLFFSRRDMLLDESKKESTKLCGIKKYKQCYSIVVILLMMLCSPAFSQAQEPDSALVTMLLQQIDSMQVKEASSDFYSGMFKSYRACEGIPHNYVPDNNIFYTAIGTFALRNLLPNLGGANKKIVEKILAFAAPAYTPYKNKDDKPFYCYWPVNGAAWPHSFALQHMQGMISQDGDDAAMAIMAQDGPEEDREILKQRLILLSNTSNGRTIKSTRIKYKKIPAYNSWLGAKTPIDFDFGVHCNIMYFMYQSKLPFTAQDTATIGLLALMIKNREYMHDPTYISPWYATSPVLLYHLTRLMGAFKIAELERYKSQIINDLYSLLASSDNIMDKVILSTSLLRLGEKPPALNLSSLKEFDASNEKRFSFVRVHGSFYFRNHLKELFEHFPYFNYKFYCPAYNRILLLEYFVLKQRLNHI